MIKRIFNNVIVFIFSFLFLTTINCRAQDSNTIKADELINFYSPKNNSIEQEQDKPRTIRTRGLRRGIVRIPEDNSDIQSQGITNSYQPSPPIPLPPPQKTPQQQISQENQQVNNSQPKVEVRKGFQNILFDVNAYTIKDSSYSQLDEIGKALRVVMSQDPNSFFIIEGHTDNKGDADYNEKLSTKRAQKVRDFLLSKYGLERNRLMALGYGENKPVASNDNEYGQSLNRRVEIVKR